MDSKSLLPKIDTALRFVLCVMVFWIPYSTAVIEVCVILSLVLWLVRRSLILAELLKLFPKRPKIQLVVQAIRPLKTPLDVPIIVFLLMTLLSGLFNPDAGSIVYAWFNKLVEWFAIFYLFAEVFHKKEHLRAVFYVWIVTASATVLDSFLQTFVTGRDIFMGHPISGEGATAGFKHNNSLGAYLAVFVPFISAFALAPVGMKKRIVAAVLAVCSAGGFLISLSRAAWLALGISGLSVVTLFAKNKMLKGFFAFISVGMFAGYILAMAGVITLPKLGPNTLSDTANWRLQIWKDSLTMVREKPLMGHGFNTYMKKFQEYRKPFHWQKGDDSGWAAMSPVYAHNCYVQMLAETGIIGFVAFMWILSALMRSISGVLLRKAGGGSGRTVLAGLFAGIIAFLIHSFFDTHFYSLQLSSYFWVTAGLAISLARLLKDSDVCDI